MKAKHSSEPNDFKLTAKEFYRAFAFNWDNINSFEDFKKAELLVISKTEIDFSKEAFGEWIDKNPDFDKYFMMCY